MFNSGICRHEGKMYQNGEEVRSADPCVEYCMCINSVVYCDEIICENENKSLSDNCFKVKYPNECCSRYECRKFENLHPIEI